MSDATVTFLISRLAIASVEFLIVGFLVATVLALFSGITPRWRRIIWLTALCKPLVTVLTGFFGGVVPVPSVVTGKLLSDLLFPVQDGGTLLSAVGGPAATVLHVVAYVWLTVTGLLLVRVWLRSIASGQLIEESIEKGYLLKRSTLNRLDPSLVVPSHARIAVTPEDAGPATLGIFRPAVILPETLVPWVNKHRDPTPRERARLCQVLRHEIAHIAHHDSLVSLLATVIVSIFWFHPIAHWAYRRIRLNNELRCDEHVVESGVAAKAYVETLMNIVTGEFSRRAFSLNILGDAGARAVLRRRLAYLLADCDRSKPQRQGVAYTMLVLLVLAMPRFLADAPGEQIALLLADGNVKMIDIEDLDRYLERYPDAVALSPDSVSAAPGQVYLADGQEADPAKSASGSTGETFTFVDGLPSGSETSETGLDIPAASELGDAYADVAPDDDLVAEDSQEDSKPKKRKSRRPSWVGSAPFDRGAGDTPILPPPG